MLPELERRAIAIGMQGAKITGHAVVFNVRSKDLGGFVEVVRPAAVQRALAPDANVVALYDHQSGAVLGRTPKTLRLWTDDRGLAFELDPAPTQAGRDAVELVTRGDVAGGSFGFRTLKDDWRHEGPLVVRELLDIAIDEISLTAFPSYEQTDVVVARRGLQAFQGRKGKPVNWLLRQHRVHG